jgi:uncharacterized protein YbjT (DUF2867 family)
MILLTGITGKVGGATATALLKRGAKIRAIVRDKTKAADWADKGVELVEGNLNDSASVEAAMEGCDKAVLILSNGKEQEQMELAFVDSAVKTGIRHFVKLSSPEAVEGTTSPVPLVHIAAEKAIRDSGLNYTLIRPHFFMQNLLGYGAAAKETGKISLPMGKGNVSMTDCNDTGEFFAEILLSEGDEHHSKSYDITGPELMSFDEVAGVFADVLDRDVVYDNCDPKAYQERIRPFLTSDWHSDAVAILFGEIADLTTPGHVETTFEDIMGRPPKSFKQLLQETIG